MGDMWGTSVACGAEMRRARSSCQEPKLRLAQLKELLFLEYGYENVAMHRRCPANNRRRKTVQNRVGCLLKRASNEFDTTTTSNARESNPGFRS